jgi:hypothetical protein
MNGRLEIDWKRETSGDFSVSIRRYERYLKDIGFRDSTINSYVGHVDRYLKFTGADKPKYLEVRPPLEIDADGRYFILILDDNGESGM